MREPTVRGESGGGEGRRGCGVKGTREAPEIGLWIVDCASRRPAAWIVFPVTCSLNLLGSQERQDKLRDMGIVDILHKLSQSPDSNLCDK